MSDAQIIYDNRNGVPAIRGTRLTVFSIMDHYLAGAGLEEISDFYRITREEATHAVNYINSHMAELTPAYSKMLERDSLGNPPDVNEMLRQSHEKFVRLQAEFQSRSSAVSETSSPTARSS